MSALSRDRNTKYVDRFHRDTVPVAQGVKIYNGGAVARNAAGYAVPAGTVAGRFCGIADETVDNTAGQDGDLNLAIRTPDGAYWAGSGLAAGDVDADVYFSTDQDVTKTAKLVYAGRIKTVVSSTECLVDHRGAYAGMTGRGTSLTTVAPTTSAL